MNELIFNLPIACTTCARAFHKAGGNAAGLAILFLLFVILAVLVAVSFFMIRMARRENEGLDPQYRDSFNPQQSIQS